jgi:hypothetical protein
MHKINRSRLLGFPTADNRTENTPVVYSSDQGFFLSENGWFDKRWMDEVSSRIPLRMASPGHFAPGPTSGALGYRNALVRSVERLLMWLQGVSRSSQGPE